MAICNGYTPTPIGLKKNLHKIRFPAPAPVGKRIRSNMKVTDVREIGNDAYDVEYEMTINVEGESKPCCVASKITRYYPS